MIDAHKKHYTDVGYYTSKGVAFFISIGFGTIIIIGAVFGWLLPTPVDATDKSVSVRSGVNLITDYGTGCQYLETNSGGLTPRMNAEGRHICNGEKN